MFCLNLKFRFSKRATKFETISHMIWHLSSKCQIKWEIGSNCVTFLEKLNFNNISIVCGQDNKIDSPIYHFFISTDTIKKFHQLLINHISSHSIRGNNSLFDLVTVHKCAETIQGWKLCIWGNTVCLQNTSKQCEKSNAQFQDFGPLCKRPASKATLSVVVN